MTPKDSAQLSNLEQVTLNKNRFLAHSSNLSDAFESTGDLKKVMAACATARVHRAYLRDEILYTSPPVKPGKKK